MEILQDPIVIIKDNGDGKQGYIISVTSLDPKANEPERFGVILSDLIDHIAHAYEDVGLGKYADLRAHILKTLNKEDEFKRKDPKRGGISGTTIMPKTN